MAITSPIRQHNRLQNEHSQKKRVQNQIDYVLVRYDTNTKVSDSEATISTTANPDHKPVIGKMEI